MHPTIKPKAHPTSPVIGPKRIVPVFGRIKPGYNRVCLLCLTFNFFLSFFCQSEALHSSTLWAPYERRRTGRPPHPTPHTTPYEEHTYPPTHFHRDTIQHTDTNLHPDHRRLCFSCIRNRGRLDLPYVAGASRGRREAGYMCNMLLVWRGVGCRGWSGSLRTSAFLY